MKILCDTSVIIAALIESHPKHVLALPVLQKAIAKKTSLIVASHTLAELYAILNTLPVKPRISPSVAWQLINTNIIQVAKVVSLTTLEYESTIKQVSEKGLSGGIIYDALIAKVALKTKVDQLLTLNLKHFEKIWTGEKYVLSEP